jgi:hypothetical protein
MADLQRSPIFAQAEDAAQFLTNGLDATLRKPRVAIVCGSGLGGLADAVHEKSRAEYDYSSIPHFPCPTGRLLFCVDSLTWHYPYSVPSFGARREVSFRDPWAEDPSCFDGWSHAVCLLFSF